MMLGSLFNTRKRPIQKIRMFGNRRRNNRGTMLWSLIGLVATAVTTALIQRITGNNNQLRKPIQNLANSVKPLQTGVVEFANELMPQNATKSNKTGFKNTASETKGASNKEY